MDINYEDNDMRYKDCEGLTTFSLLTRSQTTHIFIKTRNIYMYINPFLTSAFLFVFTILKLISSSVPIDILRTLAYGIENRHKCLILLIFLHITSDEYPVTRLHDDLVLLLRQDSSFIEK